MRRLALLLLFLASCTPAPDADLRLVIIDNPETGLSRRELPPDTLRSLGLAYGLAVVRAGGMGERAGLKIGDVVYGVNQRKVKSLEEFNQLLAQQAGRRLGLLVRRGRTDFYVAVDPAGVPREGAPKGMPGLPPVRDTLLRT
jgi:membrane-associated protease RseP (regulator of RpoE activity)